MINLQEIGFKANRRKQYKMTLYWSGLKREYFWLKSVLQLSNTVQQDLSKCNMYS